jgi:hypothetical protein
LASIKSKSSTPAQEAEGRESQSQKQRSQRIAGATEARFKTGGSDFGTNKSGVLFAVALDEFLQVRAGGSDVLPKGVGGDVGIFRAARVEEFVVGFSGHVQFAGEHQMEARVAIAVIVQSLEEREHHGAIRGGIERGMERPIPLAPGFNVGIIFERFLELLKNLFSSLKIFFGEIGDGLAEHVAFQDRARFEELHNFVGREGGDHSPAIGDDGNQAFCGQMTERFAHRDAADLKFGGNGVLPELLAFAEFAVKDFVAEALNDGGGQGLARDGA